jgi:flagellar basal-body rod protein FlgB
MSVDLSASLDIASRVMDFTNARARALNENLAHASVPGYKRVDVDFSALAQAIEQQDARKRTQALASLSPTVGVDRSAPAGADGNTVDFEREQIQIDKNALIHEIAAAMVSVSLQQMRSAISGHS